MSARTNDYRTADYRALTAAMRAVVPRVAGADSGGE